jgi:2-polyprenyl-3-methyl-5-hydroxy-6-metoxy-1,4-benzoquinol methylase
MQRNIYTSLAKIALTLHNFSYKLSARLAIKAEGGLHPKHRLMNYHQFFINNIAKNDVVLDIGCGNGALAHDLAMKAAKVLAIDISSKNIRQARKKYPAHNIEYISGDATSYSFKERFDIVVLSNVLEHMDERVLFLERIRDLASKFLVRVPMLNRDWITLYTEYTKNSFYEEMQSAGLTVKSLDIMWGEIYASVEAAKP